MLLLFIFCTSLLPKYLLTKHKLKISKNKLSILAHLLDLINIRSAHIRL